MAFEVSHLTQVAAGWLSASDSHSKIHGKHIHIYFHSTSVLTDGMQRHLWCDKHTKEKVAFSKERVVGLGGR